MLTAESQGTARLSRHAEWILVAAIVILPVMILFSLSVRRQSEALAKVGEANRRIVVHTNNLLMAVREAESGQRGFLLTGQEAYLKPFRAGSVAASKEMAIVEEATSLNTEQRSSAESMRVLVDKKLAELRLTVHLRQTAGLDAALAVVRTNEGQQLTDQIHALCEQVKANQNADLVKSRMATTRLMRQASVFTVAGCVLLALVLVLSLFIIRRTNREREGHMNVLRDQALILDLANDSIVIFDDEDRIVYWNQGAQRLYGWAREEAQGQMAHNLLKTRFPRPLEEITSQLSLQGHWRGELVHTRRDGTPVAVMAAWTLKRDETTGRASVVAMNYDITEQKHAEAALLDAHRTLESKVQERTAELNATREKLQAVLDCATNVSIIATDTKGTITVFNSGAENMLGYSAEEMVGRHTPALIHLPKEVMARGREMTAELGRTVEGFNVFVDNARLGLYEEREWTYVRKDGSHLTVNLVVTGSRDANGTTIGFLGVAMDVTARKLADAALLDARHALELRVAELAKINQELAQKNQEVEAFVYIVSHDLRTPLVNLQGFCKELELSCQELREQLAKQELREQLAKHDLGEQLAKQELREQLAKHDLREQIAKQELREQLAKHDLREQIAKQELREQLAKHDLREQIVTNDLRENLAGKSAIARIINEDIPGSLRFISASTTKFHRLISALLELSRQGRQEYQPEELDMEALVQSSLDLVRLSIAASGVKIKVQPIPTVYGDATAVGQILGNLIGNAMKYQKPGRPGEIEIAGAAEGEKIHCWVKDNGAGFPASARPRLFQVFQRFHPDLATGEGMGLAMVKRIVERHGGSIWLDSEEGMGSTFHFTLPAKGNQQ